MNDNDERKVKTYISPDLKIKLRNGVTPEDVLKRQYTPRDLNDAQLAQMDHAEWLEGFSTQMGTSTSVKMTPFRQGVITRLHWASRYVKLLEKTLKKQDGHVAKLEHDLSLALTALAVKEKSDEHDNDLRNSARPKPDDGSDRSGNR